MQTKHYLTLSDAEFLLDHAHQYAIQNSFNVSIALVDETGNLLAMKRMDGAAPMTANLAIEKARCSAMSRRPSKLFEDIPLDTLAKSMEKTSASDKAAEKAWKDPKVIEKLYSL